MGNTLLRACLVVVPCLLAACTSSVPDKFHVSISGTVPTVFHGNLDGAGRDIRVDTITFSGPGTGCIPAYDHKRQAVIEPPEYSWERGTPRPAVCLLGKPRTVHVTFRAQPDIKSAEIWAVGSAGGLNSKDRPVLVTFANGVGEGTFTLNDPPDRVGKQELKWAWGYKGVPGKKSTNVSSPYLPKPPLYGMDVTGPVTLYTVLAQPKEPMTIPWIEVLDYATLWAANGSTEADVRMKLANNLYGSGLLQYVHSSSYNLWIGFNLSDLLDDLHRGNGYRPMVNCVDVANFYQVLSSALGLDDKMTTITAGDYNKGQYIDYKPLLPIGYVSSACEGGTWNYHEVDITTDDKIIDATAKVHCDTLSAGNLTLVQYLHLLSSTYGIGIHPNDRTVSDPY